MSALDDFRKQKDDFMRSPDSPLRPEDRASFSGLRYYPEEPSLVFDLDLDMDVPHDVLTMETSTGSAQAYKRAGRIRFNVDGQEAMLNVYEDEHGYFLPFRDATSGQATYEAGRYLEPELKDEKLHVDFNYAYNPYCAYRSHFSCPVPPVENWLKSAIRAGEKKMHD